MPNDRATVYRICGQSEWAAAAADGVFRGGELDRADGFIHLSARDQIKGTLEAHFSGVGGLVLLRIDAAALGTALRWETSRAGQTFPHLYAPLPAVAVIDAAPIPDEPQDRTRLLDGL